MNQTKERILAEGVDLLSRNGFAGITLGGLAEQTGLSKSGLFAHFKSKEGVQLELLEETARRGAAAFLEPAMRAPKGLPRLRSVVDGWFGWSEKAGLHGGCPVAAGLFEYDDAPDSDPVRGRLLAMEKQWRGLLAQLVVDTISTGTFQADLDVDQFVWELCGIYLSHHASSRFIRDRRAGQRAHLAFDQLVRRSSATRSTISRQTISKTKAKGS